MSEVPTAAEIEALRDIDTPTIDVVTAIVKMRARVDGLYP